jgi:hypothetical protein
MPAYVFTDEWQVAADPATVWDVVRDVGQWPAWWPSARSVTQVASPGAGGEVWRFVFRTRLPYDMGFDARVLADDPMTGVETAVTGRVEGSGRWRVTGVEGGSAVCFDWVVSPQVAWMRALSPVARPAFVWNHRALMREGGEALARRLDTRLLAPPGATPALAPAVAAAAAWPAAGLGLLALLAGLRRPRRR